VRGRGCRPGPPAPRHRCQPDPASHLNIGESNRQEYVGMG